MSTQGELRRVHQHHVPWSKGVDLPLAFFSFFLPVFFFSGPTYSVVEP